MHVLPEVQKGRSLKERGELFTAKEHPDMFILRKYWDHGILIMAVAAAELESRETVLRVGRERPGCARAYL